MSSFDPPTELLPWSSINPRPLAPLQRHPEPSILPSLPSPPRQPAFSHLYTLSTHIIPAAYPRVTADVPEPERVPDTGIDKEERNRIGVQKATEMLDAKWRQINGEPMEGSRKLLWNCINRYARNDMNEQKGLTLFLAHANGFPKEIWEPSLQHLLLDPSVPQIDEIWAWEAIQHGDAALINHANLSGIYDWMDNSRDILNFLINYLPSAPTSSTLPVHLARLPEDESESRKVSGYQDRILAAVGHSFGGCTVSLVAINHPALFSSIVLVDPIISQPGFYKKNPKGLPNYLRGALLRREHWPTREEALRLFKKVPFFAAWDPEVLKTYVNHGLAPDPKGGFRLKMSGIQEAVVFAEAHVPYEVWELIDRLDEKIELRWVMPGHQGSFTSLVQRNGPSKPYSDDEAMRVKVWRRPKNASNIRIPKAGHLIPHEAPRPFAQDLLCFLQRKYGKQQARL